MIIGGPNQEKKSKKMDRQSFIILRDSPARRGEDDDSSQGSERKLLSVSGPRCRPGGTTAKTRRKKLNNVWSVGSVPRILCHFINLINKIKRQRIPETKKEEEFTINLLLII